MISEKKEVRVFGVIEDLTVTGSLRSDQDLGFLNILHDTEWQ